jgi:hypothetical protein
MLPKCDECGEGALLDYLSFNAGKEIGVWMHDWCVIGRGHGEFIELLCLPRRNREVPKRGG